jgi:lipoprotein-releasing system permease protein
VAAGVAALVIALAINNGFRNTLQSGLLSATAHISIQERNPSYGIENWESLVPRLRRVPRVISVTPGLYGQVAIKSPLVSSSAVLKGVPVGAGAATPEILRRLKSGSLVDLNGRPGEYEMILGARLADQLGLRLHSPVTVIGTDLTPFKLVPSLFTFRVAGIFETGLYEIDAIWAFTSLSAAQRVLDLPDVVNSMELRLDDIYAAASVAPEVQRVIGPKLIALTWMEQNRPILNALQLEKTVSLITVSLIECIAALNILVVLVMLVMEKRRDIAILISMGASRAQIRRIFILQGLTIGALGCVIGLVIGYGSAALFSHYRLLRLDEQIYSIDYVPFQSRWTDGLWIAALALFTSFIATLQPSRSAASIAPAEALRYE